MRTRLSEIEQLRLDKKTLTEECSRYEDDLKYKINYTKNNLGNLVVNSILSSTKIGLKELRNPFSDRSLKDKGKKKFSVGNFIIKASPILWEIAQPLLLGLAVKKVKSIFTKK